MTACLSRFPFQSLASDAARREVPLDRGVRYGPKEGQMLDVFGGPLLPNGNCNKLQWLLCLMFFLPCFLYSVSSYPVLISVLSWLSSQILSLCCPLAPSPFLCSLLSYPLLSPPILSIYISCQQFLCPFSNIIFNYFCFVLLLSSTDAPILVYIHGGYWQQLSRDQSAYCVVPQYQSGIRVIIVGYDLAPRGHFQYPSLCFLSCNAFKTKRTRWTGEIAGAGIQEICTEFWLGNSIERDHVVEVDLE